METIDEADVVYVHDYCYTMWLLADHHAREHWWLKQNYEPPSGTGRTLLSIYRQACCCTPCLPDGCEGWAQGSASCGGSRNLTSPLHHGREPVAGAFLTQCIIVHP